MNRLHRTLNLICCVLRLRLMPAAKNNPRPSAKITSRRKHCLHQSSWSSLSSVIGWFHRSSYQKGKSSVVNVQEASLRREISMNCLMSETSRGMMGDCCRSDTDYRAAGDQEELESGQTGRRATSGEAAIVRKHLAIRV